jgi:hypothetical protein
MPQQPRQLPVAKDRSGGVFTDAGYTGSRDVLHLAAAVIDDAGALVLQPQFVSDALVR